MKYLLSIVFIVSVFCTPALAQVSIEPSTVNVDTMVDNEVIELSFIIKNDGTSPIDLLYVEGPGKKRFNWTGNLWIDPGKTGRINIEYNSAMGFNQMSMNVVCDKVELPIQVEGICIYSIQKLEKDGMEEVWYYHNGQKMAAYETLGAAYKESSPKESIYHSYTEWYKDGTIKKKYILEDKVYSAETFHSNGERASIGQFKGSVEQAEKFGLWTYFHSNGKEARKGYYKKDLRKGIWLEWHATGKLKARGEYKITKGIRKVDIRGRIDGEISAGVRNVARSKERGSYPIWYEEFYLNGTKKYDLVFFDSGRFNGLYTSWYSNGQMNAQWFIKKDDKGVDRLWCKEGTILLDYNSFRNLDIKVEPFPEGCEFSRNLLLYLPDIHTGALYDVTYSPN